MSNQHMHTQSKPRNLGVRIARDPHDKTVNVCWGQWPVVQDVKLKDVSLVRALVALRVQTLHQNNTLAARIDSVQ